MIILVAKLYIFAVKAQNTQKIMKKITKATSNTFIQIRSPFNMFPKETYLSKNDSRENRGKWMMGGGMDLGCRETNS